MDAIESEVLKSFQWQKLDAAAFVKGLRARRVTPHIAIDGRVSKSGVVRHSEIDARTTRHPGYAISLRIRKRIEEVFGWMRTVGPMRQTKLRGTRRVGWAFTLTAAAYNLVRIRTVWCTT